MADLAWSASRTEQKLAEFVRRLAAQMTEEEEIELVPSQVWSTDHESKPPKIHYRVADVAVRGDRILPQIAHEIATIQFTDPTWHWTFKVRRPNAARLCFDVAEGARIDREFSERYPGAASLFEMQHGEGATGIWTADVAKGFKDLPAKWKFLLNADRMLWGLDPLGSPEDRTIANEAIDSFVEAALSRTSQDCADALKPAIDVLDREMDKEREFLKRVRKAAEQLKLEAESRSNVRPDLDDPEKLRADDEDKDTRSGEQTDHAFDQGAEQDDRQIGGEDGTAGARELADGAPNGPESESDESGGETGGEADGADGADDDADAAGGAGGAGSDGGDDDLEDDEAMSGDGSFRDEDEEDEEEGGAEAETDEDEIIEDDDDPMKGGGIKPSNLLELMAQEQAGSSNRTIRALRREEKDRAAEAKDVQRRMNDEANAALGAAEDVIPGRGKKEKMQRMAANARIYEIDKQRLARPIARLRTHVESVLRDNDRQSWGGNYTAGRHVKRGKLHRIATGDRRLFDRREVIGGKSYAVAVLVDQSASMADRPSHFDPITGEYKYSGVNLQSIAYDAALVLFEAAAERIDLSIIGFSDFHDSMMAGGYYRGRRQRYRRGLRDRNETDLVRARTYSEPGDLRNVVQSKLPELRTSWSSTPTDAGISHARDWLRTTESEIKAIIIVTDGSPNSPRLVRVETIAARREGIGTHALLVGKASQYMGGRTDEFVAAMDSAHRALNPDEIAPAVYGLFKSLVRRKRIAS